MLPETTPNLNITPTTSQVPEVSAYDGQPEVLNVNDPRNTASGAFRILAPTALEVANGLPEPADTGVPTDEPFGGESSLMPELDGPDSRLAKVANKLGKFVGKMGIVQRVRSSRHGEEPTSLNTENEAAGQDLFDWAEADSGVQRMGLNTAKDTVAKRAANRLVDASDFKEAKAEVHKAWEHETAHLSPEESAALSETWQSDHIIRVERENEAGKVDGIIKVMDRLENPAESLTGQLNSVRSTLAQLRGSADNSMNKLDRNKLLRDVNERYRNVRDAYLSTVEDQDTRDALAETEATTLATGTLRVALEAFDHAEARYDELKTSGKATREELRDYRSARGRFHAARRDAMSHGLKAKLNIVDNTTASPESSHPNIEDPNEAITLKQKLDEVRRLCVITALVPHLPYSDGSEQPAAAPVSSSTPQSYHSGSSLELSELSGTTADRSSSRHNMGDGGLGSGDSIGDTSAADAKHNYATLRENWGNQRQYHPEYKDLSDQQAEETLKLEEMRTRIAYQFATGNTDIDNSLAKRYYELFNKTIRGLDDDQRMERHAIESQMWTQEREAYTALLSKSNTPTHQQTLRGRPTRAAA